MSEQQATGFKWVEGVHRIAVKGWNFGPLGIRQTPIDSLWRVTHIASGFCAGKFAREAQAKRFVEEVANAEWNKVVVDDSGYVADFPREITQLVNRVNQQIEQELQS